MRPSLLVSLVLLSIFVSQVQGIRLNKGFLASGDQKIHEGAVIKASNGAAVGNAVNCKQGHCSGDSRKLMTIATSSPPTTTSTSKNDKKGGTVEWSMPEDKPNTSGKEKSFSPNSSSVSDHREAASEHYPDILDIAGMDYSPANRKPPIHN
ncbi:hypothetical protein NMG60_11013162 [Bertholletia excelsa]